MKHKRVSRKTPHRECPPSTPPADGSSAHARWCVCSVRDRARARVVVTPGRSTCRISREPVEREVSTTARGPEFRLGPPRTTSERHGYSGCRARCTVCWNFRGRLARFPLAKQNHPNALDLLGVLANRSSSEGSSGDLSFTLCV